MPKRKNLKSKNKKKQEGYSPPCFKYEYYSMLVIEFLII